MVRRKRVTRRFPLDSPNWIPIVNALQSLCDLTGNRQLAAKDLTNALADRDVPSMRRYFSGWRQSPPVGAVLLEPDGELLPAAYWTEHEVRGWSEGSPARSPHERQTATQGISHPGCNQANCRPRVAGRR